MAVSGGLSAGGGVLATAVSTGLSVESFSFLELLQAMMHKAKLAVSKVLRFDGIA